MCVLLILIRLESAVAFPSSPGGSRLLPVGRLLRLKSPDEREGMRDEEERDAGASDETHAPPAGAEMVERSQRRQECG